LVKEPSLTLRLGQVLSTKRQPADQAVAFCGRESGQTCDKFKETGLTPVPSTYVRPPSIAECPVHVECSVYHKQRPPHFILTPGHREKPLEAQHTIYFAEVLGAFVQED
jgi:flavin reductase (DIM6/NTAB) family NADH-FMN oxidoreductase RutF